jgi:hypothetical protein
VEITYRLNPEMEESTRDFGSVGRGDLLWHFFPGDVGLRVDGATIETRFGWVPVFHFALSLIHICQVLAVARDSSSRYVFTEADDSIAFHRNGETVRIEASFGSPVLTCSMIQLCNAVVEFALRIVSEIGASYPSLLENALSEEVVSKARELVY